MNKHAAMDGFRSYIHIVDVACRSFAENDAYARAIRSMSFEVHHVYLARCLTCKCEEPCSVLTHLLTQPPLLDFSYVSSLVPWDASQGLERSTPRNVLSGNLFRFDSVPQPGPHYSSKEIIFRLLVPQDAGRGF